MSLKIRSKLIQLQAQYDLLKALTLCELFNFQHMTVFLQKLGRPSTKLVLQHFGACMSEDCTIEAGLITHNARGSFANLTIEKNCHLGKQVFLDLRDSIYILQGSTVSMRTMILTHFDPGYAGPFGSRYIANEKPVWVGPRAYVGAGAILLPGIHVGEGSFVAAGALVNKDVPPKTLVAGVPARVISIFSDFQ